MKFAKLALLGMMLTGCGAAAVSVVDTMGGLVWQESDKKYLCVCVYVPNEGLAHKCVDKQGNVHNEVDCWSGEIKDGGN